VALGRVFNIPTSSMAHDCISKLAAVSRDADDVTFDLVGQAQR
jgi:hypothetical protein